MTDTTFRQMLVDNIKAELRERNRAYGKASETIGRLRAEVARLRLERAEWRGTVNGDVLVEVLAASAPEQWTPEDRRAHAEHVIEAMQASGIRVYAGGRAKDDDALPIRVSNQRLQAAYSAVLAEIRGRYSVAVNAAIWRAVGTALNTYTGMSSSEPADAAFVDGA